MRVTTWLTTACLMLAGSSCTMDSNQAIQPPQVNATEVNVTATRVNGGIKIVNSSQEAMARFVFNRNRLAQYAVCIDPSPACVNLPAGVSVTVADTDINGYVPGMREAEVYFYRVVPDGRGGYRTEDIARVVIQM